MCIRDRDVEGSTSFRLTMAWIPGVGSTELVAAGQTLDADRPERLTKAIAMIKVRLVSVLSDAAATGSAVGIKTCDT
eukprot:2786856-Rhodomonas_salina.1